MNNAVLIGRLTKDPEMRYLPNGTPYTTFILAVDRQLSKDKKKELEDQGKQTADFINIVVWGKQAENCANHLAKGRLAAVQGRIQSRSYDAKDGTKRYVIEVVANNVEFLEWRNKDNQQNDSDFDIPTGFEPVDDPGDCIPF